MQLDFMAMDLSISFNPLAYTYIYMYNRRLNKFLQKSFVRDITVAKYRRVTDALIELLQLMARVRVL